MSNSINSNTTIPQKLFTIPIFLSVPVPTYTYIIPDRPEIRVWVSDPIGSLHHNNTIYFYSTSTNDFENSNQFIALKSIFLGEPNNKHGLHCYDEIKRIEANTLQELFPPIVDINATKRYFTSFKRHYRTVNDIFVVSNTSNYLNELSQLMPNVEFLPPNRPEESIFLAEDRGDCLMGCGSLIEINEATATYLKNVFHSTWTTIEDEDNEDEDKNQEKKIGRGNL